MPGPHILVSFPSPSPAHFRTSYAGPPFCRGFPRLASSGSNRSHHCCNGRFGGGSRGSGCCPYSNPLYAGGTRPSRTDKRPFGSSRKALSRHRSILRCQSGSSRIECANPRFRSAAFWKHSFCRTFSTQHKENVAWQRKKPRDSMSYFTTR